ncbi:MAG TPA: methyltransferase domain-containing protein [Methylomirabilota bacterium]|nr:methyltransferase domain-containing protein [Methylomirabilota bacterium]
MANDTSISGYWEREGLGRAILDALAAAGRRLDALTVDDLAPADHFHGGGLDATLRLARLAGLDKAPAGTRVLDVGGGIGGPARTLATRYGCRVTVIDLTDSFVRAAQLLTDRLGLGDLVTHRVGDALALPFDDGAFDVVWTQNSGMNIADKAGLYGGIHRVLRRGGLLATQEPMAGPAAPILYPVMWARDERASFLRPPAAMRALLEASGFRVRAWDDVTAETAGPVDPAAIPAYAAPRLIMGAGLDEIIRVGHRNRQEGRLVSVQAVLERL